MVVRETDPFHHLGLNLQLQIFSNLSIDKEMGTASRVCKVWHKTLKNPELARLQFEQMRQKKEIVFNAWKQWHDCATNRFKSNYDLIENLKKCPFIETLDLSNSDADDVLIKKIGALSLPSLKVLLLKNCNRVVNPDFESFSNLVTLDLSNCRNLRQPKFSGLSKLSSMHLKNCTVFNFSFKELHSLKFLDLSENSFVDRDLNILVHDLTQLETLILNTCKHLRQPDLRCLISLKKLELCACFKLVGCNLENLFFLQNVLLSATIVTDDFVNSISQQNLPSLEDLTMSYCHQLERPIFKLSSLKTLELNCCAKLRIVDLEKSPSIEKVSLDLNAEEIITVFPTEYYRKQNGQDKG
ncbi:MAG TPA: hypothetical protein VLG49_02425 [Rhabdochlamydiaceae bacterium]|nr:hypothetical protein [Rhabdochlamydiaceae bacterium]